jgi:hypothetical protein
MGHSSAANATSFTVAVARELTTGAPLLAFEKWPSTAAAKKLVHIFIKNTSTIFRQVRRIPWLSKCGIPLLYPR